MGRTPTPNDILREPGVSTTSRAPAESVQRTVGENRSTVGQNQSAQREVGPTVIVKQQTSSGVTDHGALTGLSDDDHPQYLTPAEGDLLYAPIGTTGVTAHDALTGLGDDDHTQYLNTDRHTALAGDHVTNGDTHDHSGGDGGQVDHGTLAGLSDDDHSQYHNDGRAVTWHAGLSGSHVTNGDTHDHFGGDGGQVDHGTLAGLGDDDHSLYHTDGRADTWHGTLSGSHVTNGDSHNHVGGDGGQVSHGDLSGLGSDDHSQYLTDARHTALSGDHVTNGDSHDHSGGDGAQIDHTTLSNLNSASYTHLTSADHTDLTDGGATTLHKHDHGGMDGLTDNDHPQYKVRSGFADRTATMSYTDGVFSIAPVSNYDVWTGGVKWTISDERTVDIDNDNTLHYVYFDTDGVLKVSTSAWDILGNAAPCALVFRVSAAVAAIGDERHTDERNKHMHEWAHETIGARYDSLHGGLTGTFDATSFSITPGSIFDEDLEHEIATTQTSCRLWYRSGLSAMTFASPSTTVYKLNGTNIQYDNAGTLTDANNNYYVCYYVFATNDIGTEIYSLVGQNQHSTVAAAVNEAVPSFAGLSTVEWKLLYKVIYRNTGNPPTYNSALDYRNVSGVPVSFSATSHSSLTNLDADDHTQYLTDARHTALTGDHVTNGDTHDHNGGDGGQIEHDTLSGLADDDHIQYHNDSRADTWHTALSGGHVTNGDSHNHSGGDGADIAHHNLTGLLDDDHTQYLTSGRADLLYEPLGGGVTDHGLLTGLGDDDHSQYHNDSRADTWHTALTGDHVSDFATHDHDGGDGGQIDHTKLSNIGTLTHANIDSYLDQAVKVASDPKFHTVGVDTVDHNFHLILACGNNYSEDRTLTFVTGDTNRNLTFSGAGNVTIGDWFDQSVKTSAQPQFAGAYMTGILYVDHIGQYTAHPITFDNAVTAITGNVNIGDATLGLLDTNASHYLRLDCGSDLTADRVLSFVTGDAAKTITLTSGAAGKVLTSDADGNASWATPSGGMTSLTQATHGFAVGDVLYHNGTIYAKAKADAEATAEAIGIVASVDGTDNFVLQTSSYITGLSGLTAGAVYYLSDATAGLLTATEPTTDGSISKPLMIAVSTTTGYVFNMRGVTIGGVATYHRSFVNADLSTGSLTVTHNLGHTYVQVCVSDNNSKVIVPDDITFTSSTVTTIDLTSYGTLTGTWHVSVFDIGGTMTTYDQSLNTTDSPTFDSVGVHDTDDSHHLVLKCGSNLTGNRDLTFTTGDAARTLTINGNPTLNDWFDQSVKTSDTVVFGDITTSSPTPDIAFRRSTTSFPTAGVSVGSQWFYGYNETTAEYVTGASIQGLAQDTWTNGNYYTDLYFATNQYTRAILKGDSATITQLQLTGTAAGNSNVAYLSFYDSGGNRKGWVGDGSAGESDIALYADAGNLKLYGGGTLGIYINTSGYVGILTASPSAPLYVNGNATSASGTSSSYGIFAGSTFTITGNATHYGIGMESIVYPAISNTKTNSGYTKALNLTMFRTVGGDYGTLTGLYGLYMVTGHYTGANSSISTGSVYGAAVNAYNKVGTISGNIYGIYYNSDLSGGTTSGTHYGLYIATGYAYYGGSSTWYTSDRKMKKNITRLSSGIVDKVKLVDGVEFEWDKDVKKDADDRKNYGFIAQDMEIVFPDLVMEHDTSELLDEPGNNPVHTGKAKSINFNGMIPVLWEAVKELSERLEILEKK